MLTLRFKRKNYLFREETKYLRGEGINEELPIHTGLIKSRKDDSGWSTTDRGISVVGKVSFSGLSNCTSLIVCASDQCDMFF